ncbi:Family of serine hydrolases 3 [Diaporthe australafricana]|uniref:Family of serine hydrolases 3 n=1 Tax=Diaporthe australafricana TaxID=127596 RepID=A0ABR3WRH7_9PEZI
MAVDQGETASAGPADTKPEDKAMREVKILMLHGYTQSGPLFRAKTRALEKLLAKSLAPMKLQLTLFYPTAPSRLSPKDIPGYQPSGAGPSDGGADSEMDAWAWFRKDEAGGNYRLLREGFESLARCIRDDAGGHVDGVVGFSQGGALAAMLASALEHFDGDGKQRQPPPSDDTYDWGWVPALREANGGRALRFAVVYSGFFAPPPGLGWLYEPKIMTPTLQFIGSLDTVVEESRSRGLEARSENPVMVVHPGGHYVPVNKQWVMPLVGFVRQCCEDGADES